MDLGIKDMDSGVRDTDLGVKDMDSGIRDMDSGIRDTDSEVRDTDSGVRDMDLGMTLCSSPTLLPGWLFPAQWDLSIPMENPQESVHGEKRECCCPSAAQPGMCLFLGIFWPGLALPFRAASQNLSGQQPPRAAAGGQREFCLWLRAGVGH